MAGAPFNVVLNIGFLLLFVVTLKRARKAAPDGTKAPENNLR